MKYCDGFVGSVGNTPLIRLKGVSEETGCEILGKAEFLNPSGSVKDRAAVFIVSAAEAKGELGPGGTVVEGTAGNTGIGLAHVCNARGYRCIIVIPETQSPEKLDLLRALGAEVRPVPAVPYKDPNNFQKMAGRLADEMDNTIWANQFDNLANREAHLKTTGPEIWRDTDGKIDAFVSTSGPGGTIAGTSIFLKSKNPNVVTVLADPTGTATWLYVKHGLYVCDQLRPGHGDNLNRSSRAGDIAVAGGWLARYWTQSEKNSQIIRPTIWDRLKPRIRTGFFVLQRRLRPSTSHSHDQQLATVFCGVVSVPWMVWPSLQSVHDCGRSEKCREHINAIGGRR